MILRIFVIVFILIFVTAVIFVLVAYIPPVKEAFIRSTKKIPKDYTELYFKDHLALPGDIILYKRNSFDFIIHNLENKDMRYSYEVYMEMGGERQYIDKDSVFLENNEYKIISQDFFITIPAQKAKIIINLVNKDQQIHFWMGTGNGS